MKFHGFLKDFLDFNESREDCREVPEILIYFRTSNYYYYANFRWNCNTKKVLSGKLLFRFKIRLHISMQEASSLFSIKRRAKTQKIFNNVFLFQYVLYVCI